MLLIFARYAARDTRDAAARYAAFRHAADADAFVAIFSHVMPCHYLLRYCRCRRDYFAFATCRCFIFTFRHCCFDAYCFRVDDMLLRDAFITPLRRLLRCPPYIC